MPLSVFKKLEKVEMKPSNIGITLIDNTVKVPEGVVENEMVETGDWIRKVYKIAYQLIK